MAINRDKVTAQAIKHLQAGKHEKAIAEFNKLVEDDPKDVRTLLKIGDTFVKMGRTQDAIASYERVATIYSDQGFYLKAVAVYKQMLRVDASLPEIHLKLAEMYQQLNLSSDSLQHYQQVAVFYEQQGRTAETLTILKRMVDLDPDNLPSRIKLAELFAQQGMNTEAIDEFRSAASYLREQDRFDDYVRVAERLIFFDPTALDITRELADVYMSRGEPKLALGKLQICFKADPRNVDTLGKIAESFLRMDQLPKTVSVYKEMARIFGQTARIAEANEYWQKVLQFSPGDEEASTALGIGAPAEPAAAEMPGQLTPSMVGPSIVSGPPVVAAAPVDETKEQIGRILTETDVYVKYGLRDKALEHLQRVFALEAEHLEAHVKLREIQTAMGNHDAAAEQLPTIVRIGEKTGDSRTEGWRTELNASNQPSGRLPPPPMVAPDEEVVLQEDDELIVLEEEDIGEESLLLEEEAPASTPAPMPIPDLAPVDDSDLFGGLPAADALLGPAPVPAPAIDDFGDLAAAADMAAASLDESAGLDDLSGMSLGDLAADDNAEVERDDRYDDGMDEELANAARALLDEGEDDLILGDAPDANSGLGSANDGELILGADDLGDDFGAQLESSSLYDDDDEFPSTEAALDAEARLAAEELLAGEFGQDFDSQFDQAAVPQEAPVEPEAFEPVPTDLGALDEALSSEDADRLVKAALDGIDDAFDSGDVENPPPGSVPEEPPYSLSELPSMTSDAVLQDSGFGDDVNSETGPGFGPQEDFVTDQMAPAPGLASDEPEDPFGGVVPDGFGLQDSSDASYASTEIMSLSPDELAEIRAFADAAESPGQVASTPLVGGPPLAASDTPLINASLDAFEDPLGDPLGEIPSEFSEFDAPSDVDPFSDSTVAMQAPESAAFDSDFVGGSASELDAVAAAAAAEFGAEATGLRAPLLGVSQQAQGFENDPATQFYPDEMEEAEFFLQQELLDEAREILSEIAEDLDDSERVIWMLARVDARENGDPEPAAPWEQALGDSLAEEIGDLGDLLEDVLPSADELQVSVDEVLSQFKKGVAETVDDNDAETHYDLGIAYREMGLSKDAVGEFEMAARAPSKAADSFHLIGLCHLDLSAFSEALDSFTRALLNDNASESQRAVNEYERGRCLVELDRPLEALAAFESAQELGADQSDLAERLAAARANAPVNGTLNGASTSHGPGELPRRNKNIDYV